MKFLKELLGHYSWDIAYGKYSPEIIKKGLTNGEWKIIQNPYKNKWFADPFILEENVRNIHLLVEEFDYSVNRGRIAHIVADKTKWLIVDCSIILDLPTHLSFPVIYRVGNEIFVHPENSASGESKMYRYDRINDRLVDPRLVVDQPLTDAVIRKDGKRFLMYATKVPNSNGCELQVYISNDFFGPYVHVEDLHFPHHTARMAGMFLELDGRMIRPAQDCLNGYGNAVIMYDNQQQMCRIAPDRIRYAGIHTFNILDRTFVIDLKKYDLPYLYKFVKMLKS